MQNNDTIHNRLRIVAAVFFIEISVSGHFCYVCFSERVIDFENYCYVVVVGGCGTLLSTVSNAISKSL